MKRKHKRAGVFKVGEDTIITSRPLLDLPEDHKFVRQKHAIEGRWQKAEDKGVKIMQILNHETALAVVKKYIPEMEQAAKDAKEGDSVYGCQTFLFKDSTFTTVIVMHNPPEEDDPDNLESGWGAAIVKGDSVYAEKYSKYAQKSITQMAD